MGCGSSCNFRRVLNQAENIGPVSTTNYPECNVFVDRQADFDTGGFVTGPNEDINVSRQLGKQYPTGVCPAVLVDTSGRRFEAGLLQAIVYYTELEATRQLRETFDHY